MGKIKVYLQYPWSFPDSPYYKYLINFPPKNIKYLNVTKQKGVIINKKFFWLSNFLKRKIRKWINKFKMTIPNAHLTKSLEKFDIIHCAHCLSKNKNNPWIVDLESYWQLYVGEKNKKSIKKVRKILLRKNCKKIIPWTKLAKKDFLTDFPELKGKVEIVYPAVPLKIEKKVHQKNIILLFSGRYFFRKGGLHALEVMNTLTKKYKNVRAIFQSETPKEILKKYSQNKKIEFCGLIPQNELFELYKKADILIYPGYSDSFGFAYLEAMSFGVPIITIDGFSRKDILADGKTGFIVPYTGWTAKDKDNKIDPHSLGQREQKIIRQIIKRASKLIKDKNLLKKMSKNCIKTIKNGKFSIKKRNEKLEKIYRNSLNI